MRDNLKKLFDQYYQYGYWRIFLLKKHKLPIALRQQIPFFFFSLVSILILIGILLNDVFISLALPIIYLLSLILYTLKIIIFEKKLYILWLPIVIFTLHFSYGSGFAVGIIKNLSLKRTNKN